MSESTTPTLVLTPDQQAAKTAFTAWLADPQSAAFVLSGYSGTGKSTLVKHLLEILPQELRILKLINPKQTQYEVAVTATTNKACENLSRIVGEEVSTIHSFLGLRVQTNFRTGETTLVQSNKAQYHICGTLLIVDEASYIDSALLGHISRAMSTESKVLYIGDPAQLIPVKAQFAPVFRAGFPGAELKEVVRQAKGNPILELGTMFRNTVTSGVWGQIRCDGLAVQHLDRDAFEDATLAEFSRKNWKHDDSKVLAWTNKAVQRYNQNISDCCKGSPDFQPGDFAIVNAYYEAGRDSLRTDDLVRITGMRDAEERCGVSGRYYWINGRVEAFCPFDFTAMKKLVTKARKEEDLATLDEIATWIDLRAAYATTINKSQGSTYDRVFIDLDDLRRCNSGEQIARLLYVGTTRARHQVIFTGDFA